MDENDNPLADYDLSTWEAPPPPAGIADAVISRARERHSQTVTSAPMSWKKPLAIVGGLVAAAAVALFFMFGVERATIDGRGDVKASIAQRLSLGKTSAMIEAGGELGWRRRGTKIVVTQRRGAATWTVGANDTLVLESGDPGAMGASIEAAGASLRVEVRMLNRSDARVLGVGSAVAAVVSMVTVVVYEGHVKATHDGQTVNITPGATVQFPAKMEAPDSQFAVGGGPSDDMNARVKERAAGAESAFLNYRPQTSKPDCRADAIDEMAVLAFDKGQYERAKIEWMRANECASDPNIVRKIVIAACALKDKKAAHVWVGQAALPTDQRTLTLLKEVCAARGLNLNLTNFTPDQPDPSKCDEVSCVLNNHEGACCQNLDYLRELKKAKQPLRFDLNHPHKPKDFSCDEMECVLEDYKGACCAQFKPVEYAPRPKCDATALKRKAEDYLAEGVNNTALSKFEESLRCKLDEGVVKLAYMAACRAKSEAKAKLYFAKIPENQKTQLLQICTRAGVNPE